MTTISDIQIAATEESILRLYEFINREAFDGAKPCPQKVLFRQDDEDKLTLETVTIYDPYNRNASRTSLELIVPARWLRSTSGSAYVIYDFLKLLS